MPTSDAEEFELIALAIPLAARSISRNSKMSQKKAGASSRRR
jgi:hypothetical protein